MERTWFPHPSDPDLMECRRCGASFRAGWPCRCPPGAPDLDDDEDVDPSDLLDRVAMVEREHRELEGRRTATLSSSADVLRAIEDLAVEMATLRGKISRAKNVREGARYRAQADAAAVELRALRALHAGIVERERHGWVERGEELVRLIQGEKRRRPRLVGKGGK